jgi:hypothetical protein
VKIIVLERPRRDALNIRQLLNSIFFPPRAMRHPDMKRQHSRRQTAKDLAAARRLKAANLYVPLYRVPPVEPPDDYTAWECAQWCTLGRQGMRGGGLL